MLTIRNTLLHVRIGLFSASFLAMLLLGCLASPLHAADEVEKYAPVVPGGNLQEDVEATPWTPDFATVVVKGGGLWPQLHCAADGTLLALGYNAPGHTTLPGDVDCWASTDGGQAWNTLFKTYTENRERYATYRPGTIHVYFPEDTLNYAISEQNHIDAFNPICDSVVQFPCADAWGLLQRL